MHLRSLAEHPYDSVLFPYNYVLMTDEAYRRDVEELLAVCDERSVAVQTIKSVARRRWAGDETGPRYSWYEPLHDPDAVERAVHYVLGRPRLFLLTSSDAHLLPVTLAAAPTANEIPSDEAMEADRVAQGITPLFDGEELERI
jgi:hypothetical protein